MAPALSRNALHAQTPPSGGLLPTDRSFVFQYVILRWTHSASIDLLLTGTGTTLLLQHSLRTYLSLLQGLLYAEPLFVLSTL